MFESKKEINNLNDFSDDNLMVADEGPTLTESMPIFVERAGDFTRKNSQTLSKKSSNDDKRKTYSMFISSTKNTLQPILSIPKYHDHDEGVDTPSGSIPSIYNFQSTLANPICNPKPVKKSHFAKSEKLIMHKVA